VLIGEQKLPSIRAMKMVHERINRVSNTEFLTINRFEPNIQGFAVDSLLAPLRATRLFTVTRDDVAMRAAVEAGCVLRHKAPQSRALTDILALAKSLLNLNTPAPVKTHGLFTRLGRALANK
jgi:Flp pilus assembly CpaE family ATPase